MQNDLILIKLKSANTALKSKGIPPELRIKILLEGFGIRELVSVCNNDGELLDLCSIYKNVLCKTALQEWKFYYKMIDPCDFLKRILFILFSEIEATSPYGKDWRGDEFVDENVQYELIWNNFLNMSDNIKLNNRNKFFAELICKWDDPILLDYLFKSLEKTETFTEIAPPDYQLSFDKRETNTRRSWMYNIDYSLRLLGKTVGRYGSVKCLNYLLEKAKPLGMQSIVLDKCMLAAIEYGSLSIVEFVLQYTNKENDTSSNWNDPEFIMKKAIEVDSHKVFFHLFAKGIRIRNWEGLNPSNILRKLMEGYTG